MFRALLGMPLIHKTLINIFLQKLPILQAQIVFYSAKTAKARGCINRAILEEKYLSKFYDVFSSWESTWSNKWVCEGCNTADIFKIFKRQILTALCILLQCIWEKIFLKYLVLIRILYIDYCFHVYIITGGKLCEFLNAQNLLTWGQPILE